MESSASPVVTAARSLVVAAEGHDVAALAPAGAEKIHLLAEVMRRAARQVAGDYRFPFGTLG